MKLYNPFRAHVVMREDEHGVRTYSVRRRRLFWWYWASFSYPTDSNGKVSWYPDLGDSRITSDLSRAHELVHRIRSGYYRRRAKEKAQLALGQPISMSELERMTFQHRLQQGYQPVDNGGNQGSPPGNE